MLAKQGWRLLERPNYLVARVLKNKYFPNTSFLKANVSPIASYTWKSICAARELVRKGAKWMVGDGCSIDVWRDPWVAKLPNFKVISTDGENQEGPVLVRDFIDNGEWKVELINSIFTPWEAKAILDEVLPQFPTPDSWTWAHSRKGIFTVKSAYFLALQNRNINQASSSEVKGKNIWKHLWKTKLPKKIQLFGWKVLKNGVPVSLNLARRGMKVDTCCSICGDGEESLIHALFMCNEAAIIWQTSPLRLDTKELTHKSLWEWVASLYQRIKEEEWQ